MKLRVVVSSILIVLSVGISGVSTGINEKLPIVSFIDFDSNVSLSGEAKGRSRANGNRIITAKTNDSSKCSNWIKVVAELIEVSSCAKG